MCQKIFYWSSYRFYIFWIEYVEYVIPHFKTPYEDDISVLFLKPGMKYSVFSNQREYEILTWTSFHEIANYNNHQRRAENARYFPRLAVVQVLKKYVSEWIVKKEHYIPGIDSKGFIVSFCSVIDLPHKRFVFFNNEKWENNRLFTIMIKEEPRRCTVLNSIR